MKNILIKTGNKNVGNIYLSNFGSGIFVQNKHQFISNLIKGIKSTDIGYAGFNTKKSLQNYLLKMIFDEDKKINIFSDVLDEKIIIKIIKKIVISCSKILPNNKVHIFVFPTFSKFVKEKMFGTTGYTPWKGAILIFINPQNKRWKRSLASTIGHEFNHSVFLKYNNCVNLIDAMIFEGLAEHFSRQITKSKQKPWTRVLDQDKSKKLFLKMNSKNLLQSTDQKIIRSVFFGNKKYICWTGYSIGYRIVNSFIRNNREFKWPKIITMQPKDILDRAKF